MRDNKVHKEQLKFIAAYEVASSLSTEFKDIKTDIELSLATAMDIPKYMFTSWMKTANENAKSKGHAVLYSDKVLPALTKGKFNINTTEISEDTRKKYTEPWKNTSVDCEKDKPLIGKIDGKTAIIDIPEVKEVIKDTYVCWGCLAEVCIQRQKVSVDNP